MEQGNRAGNKEASLIFWWHTKIKIFQMTLNPEIPGLLRYNLKRKEPQRNLKMHPVKLLSSIRFSIISLKLCIYIQNIKHWYTHTYKVLKKTRKHVNTLRNYGFSSQRK